jgi:hypothetical protein
MQFIPVPASTGTTSMQGKSQSLMSQIANTIPLAHDEFILHLDIPNEEEVLSV